MTTATAKLNIMSHIHQLYPSQCVKTNLLLLLLYSAQVVISANWAQLAGPKAQNAATPYIPQEWYKSATTAKRPMWSARWGHALVIINQTSPRNDMTTEENSARIKEAQPRLVLLGGDDYDANKHANLFNSDTHDTVNSTSTKNRLNGGGLRNDVWVSEPPSSRQDSAGWAIESRYLRQNRGIVNSNIVRSEMRWKQTNPGRHSPATWPRGSPQFPNPMTYDDWIICQDFFRGALLDPSICDELQDKCYNSNAEADPSCRAEALWKRSNMWSPRRGHGALVVKNNTIYVIGGRSREFTRMDDARLVGGIQDHRVETMRDHPTTREETLLKNDIWVSEDGLGRQWRLLTPGCKDPQEDVLLQTEVWSRNVNDPNVPKSIGSISAKCTKSTDCYGQAECRALTESSDNKVCVCPIFSVREHHAVAVQHRYFVDDNNNSTFTEDYMYVVGGFTSVRQSFCADSSCGSATNEYRLAMDDAWVSNDGVSWVQFKAAFGSRNSFPGRGAHAALVIHADQFKANPDYEENDILWIFGGETSRPQNDDVEYLNDIWSVELQVEPCCRKNNRGEDCRSSSNPLKLEDIGYCLPRSFDWVENRFHAEWTGRSGHVVIYEPASSNNAFQQQVFIVGGKNGSDVFHDVWSWDLRKGEVWRNDFDSKQWYRSTTDAKFYFGPGQRRAMQDDSVSAEMSMPYEHYLTVDSELGILKRIFLPLPDDDIDGAMNTTFATGKLLISKDDIDKMTALNVRTIRDLANADLYTVLNMRGFDFLWKTKNIVSNICYLRSLSIAFVNKCKLDTSHSFATTTAHSGMHRNNQRFGGSAVKISCGFGEDSEPCGQSDWDGCTPLEGITRVDVHGLGDVTVPSSVPDPLRDLEMMNCRQVPEERYFATGAFLNGNIMILGGKGGEDQTVVYRDVWSRDDSFPHAVIETKPLSRTPESSFLFVSNEASAHLFEYKVVDVTERSDVTPWILTTAERGADVSWLDDKKGGPGRGWYIMYVRAIDPSGNKDFQYSSETNVYLWYYVPPLPWGLITGYISSFVFLSLVLFFEYRRRKRKAALERYAIRRMRRKFKLHAMSEGGKTDWRDYYLKRDYKENDRRKKKIRHIPEGTIKGKKQKGKKNTKKMNGIEKRNEKGNESMKKDHERKIMRRRKRIERMKNHSMLSKQTKQDEHKGKVNHKDKERLRRKRARQRHRKMKKIK